MVTCTGCGKNMPPDPGGHEIAVEWTVARVEAHHQGNLIITYLYACPGCSITVSPMQGALFPKGSS